MRAILKPEKGRFGATVAAMTLGACHVLVHAAPVAEGAGLTARDVTAMVFKARPGDTIDFSNSDLRNLDLADVDFKKANLAGADLYGTDLTRSNLSSANLSNTRLDRATIVSANFTGANLSNATILRPTTSSTFEYSVKDAATFAQANLKGARIITFMDGPDFTGADLTDADFSPFERRGSQWATVPMSRIRSADFTGAKLRRVNFTRAILHFTRFNNADLRDANFQHADLSSVDFTGADITGADFTGASFYETKLSGARGIDKATGLPTPQMR